MDRIGGNISGIKGVMYDIGLDWKWLDDKKPPFHGGNRGSNPLGDAIFNNKTRLARVIFCVHLPISRLS